MSQTANPHELESLLTACLEGVSSEDQSHRLEQLIGEDPAALDAYVDLMSMHAMLQFRHWPQPDESPECDNISTGSNAVNTNDRPPIVTSLPPPLSSPLSTYITSSWPVAYLVATVVFAAALSIAALIHVSRTTEFVQQPGRSAPSATPSPTPSPKTSDVARITGMVDCQWVDPRTAPTGNAVPLGQVYALTSGLLELTYDTGARVILQGPVTYAVESANGGRLSLGRLSAKLEKKSEARGQRSDSANQKSEIINHQFAVRTPTATITDLGTEFGVEVAKDGSNRVHVFQGKVELEWNGGTTAKSHHTLRLTEGESAEVGNGGSLGSVSHRIAAGQTDFVRALPKRTPIHAFSTGRDLHLGQADPHWQVIAVAGNPGFKPSPAELTMGEPNWKQNDSARSQWISLGRECPEGVVCTFRTSFDLTGFWPNTIVLRGWFSVDRSITAIRLNGRAVNIPAHGGRSSSELVHPFVLNSGFVEGANTLEIDAVCGKRGPSDAPRLACLNVELEGYGAARHGYSSPIGLAGWNQDVIVESGAAAPRDATTCDLAGDKPGAWVWYEAGAGYGAYTKQGLPVGGSFVSAYNPRVTLQLQPYGGPNAAIVPAGKSATLTLAAPGRFKTLSILSCGQSASTWHAVLHFADGSSTVLPEASAPAFNDAAGHNNAIADIGCVYRGYWGNAPVGAGGHLYEDDFVLTAGDQTKTLTAIEFVTTSGAASFYAVSGEAAEGQNR